MHREPSGGHLYERAGGGSRVLRSKAVSVSSQSYRYTVFRWSYVTFKKKKNPNILHCLCKPQLIHQPEQYRTVTQRFLYLPHFCSESQRLFQTPSSGTGSLYLSIRVHIHNPYVFFVLFFFFVIKGIPVKLLN